MDGRRNLEVGDCRNLRDVGGVRTRGGEVVARGRLFRGAEPPIRESAAAELFAATGIRRILDLRMDEEVDRTGPPTLPSGCEWHRLPLFDRAAPHWATPLDRRPPSTAQRYFEMLQGGLRPLDRILEMLSDAAAKPTLVHCVAGRDRTGIVVACVLYLLDVPDEAIASDYALSEVVDDQEGRNASPENILLLLGLVRRRFGSVREMLLASGTPADRADQLRAALVE
jgi:protein-tyrosine phosphatase